MPQQSARLHLHINTIRLDRLQNISALACIDPGIGQAQFLQEREAVSKAPYQEIAYYVRRLQNLMDTVPFKEYKKFWNRSMPAARLDEYGWNANPWVWELGTDAGLQRECWYAMP